MIDALVQKLNIPEQSVVNSTFFKKLFYENTDLSKKEIEIFKKNIDKITMLFSFTEDTINIRPYKDEERDYDEIAVFQISINDKSKVNKIGNIVQRTIPYPTIIIFTLENEIQVNVATKRINKADASKNTIEEIISTHWINIDNLTEIEKDFIETINMRELPFTNCYRFYMDIFNKIFLLNTSKYINDYKTLLTKDIDNIKKLQYEISNLEVNIEEIRKAFKKENSFNKKIEYNVAIKKLEEKKIQTINDLLS